MNNLNEIFVEINNFIANGFQDFIFHPQFTGWLLVVKIVFLIISFIFASLIIWLLTASTWLKRAYLENAQEFKQFKPFDTAENLKVFKAIAKRLKSEKEIEHKLAVLEADEFFDKTLKTLDYLGKRMEDRFNQITTEVLPNLGDIKKAHEVRNKIVNDRGYRLTSDEARRVLAVFEQGFRHLGAI